MKDPFTSCRRNDINLIDITFGELIKLKFTKRENQGQVKPGDLLCATSKTQDLWIEVDKVGAQYVDPTVQLIMGK